MVGEHVVIIADSSGYFFWILAGATMLQGWYHAHWVEPSNPLIAMNVADGFFHITKVVVVSYI